MEVQQCALFTFYGGPTPILLGWVVEDLVQIIATVGRFLLELTGASASQYILRLLPRQRHDIVFGFHWFDRAIPGIKIYCRLPAIVFIHFINKQGRLGPT